MKKQLAFCIGLFGLGLLVLGIGGAATAQAQPIYMRPDIGSPGMPPYEVIAIARSAGLTPLTRPLRRGPTYVLLAADRRGRDVRVVVDAYAGDIVSVRPVYASRSYGPYGPPSRMAPPEPVYGPGAHIAPPEPAYGPSARIAPPLRDDDGGPRVIYGPRGNTEGNLLPPRNTPNTRTASTPPVAQPTPAPTPLPRPRPSIAATQAPAEPAPAAQPAAPQTAPAATPAAPQAAPPTAAETGPARPTAPQPDPPKR